METIKVNMSPNPLDVQTIHASQNDSEARQWEFELHNNGELIDTSDVKEQLVFKAYKGGTEQLLPENGSTPTTSPFLGDIRYPQGLLSDQEFTYRQSPTEEDGLAKITNIKGNTIVWNQLVQNGNFADTTYWNASNATFSVANNTATVTRESESTSQQGIRQQLNYSIVNGNKYLISFEAKSSVQDAPLQIAISDSVVLTQPLNYTLSTSMTTYRQVFTASSFDVSAIKNIYARTNINQTFQIKNIMLIDLSKMFGSGNEPTAEDFTSLFPLSYYSYNLGSLLSFNGNGIKTVSKNQFDTQVVTTSYAGLVLTKTPGAIRANYSGGSQYAGFNFYGSPVFTDTFLKGKYKLSFDVRGLDTQWTAGLRRGASFLGGGQAIAFSVDGHYSFTIDTEANPNCYLSFARTGNKTTAYDVTFSNIQLEFGTTATSYEPYTSSTLSLPVSTYFPNGMNGQDDTYDELTSAVATKRFEKDSLGDLTWARRTTNIFSANLPSQFDASKDISCFMSNRLPTVFVSGYTLAEDGYISIYKTTTTTSSTSIYLNMTSQSIDTVADLQTWLSNNPTELVYPLATPIETSFTTASLVTENAEIPLSNNDGVLIGKCTEQLSENPGFFDAKIKLSDSDGTCYSNKLQLHVERKPS